MHIFHTVSLKIVNGYGCFSTNEVTLKDMGKATTKHNKRKEYVSLLDHIVHPIICDDYILENH